MFLLDTEGQQLARCCCWRDVCFCPFLHAYFTSQNQSPSPRFQRDPAAGSLWWSRSTRASS